MDKLLAYAVRLMVWLSGYMKPLSRLGLCRYEEWQQGEKLKILLVGYNGARNTGADARVVALTQQIEQALGTDKAELTVMTLSTDNVQGYFSKAVHLYRFSTLFFFALLRATSRSHVAILCEGSTLTRTFADALCVFYCQAAGIGHQLSTHPFCRPCALCGGTLQRSPPKPAAAHAVCEPARTLYHLALHGLAQLLFQQTVVRTCQWHAEPDD
ncbi:MAG: hypothetical protein J5971_05930 [Prevotella sp.]|nr:hypothetical protein [Prevotella sp.]